MAEQTVVLMTAAAAMRTEEGQEATASIRQTLVENDPSIQDLQGLAMRVLWEDMMDPCLREYMSDEISVRQFAGSLQSLVGVTMGFCKYAQAIAARGGATAEEAAQVIDQLMPEADYLRSHIGTAIRYKEGIFLVDENGDAVALDEHDTDFVHSAIGQFLCEDRARLARPSTTLSVSEKAEPFEPQPAELSAYMIKSAYLSHGTADRAIAEIIENFMLKSIETTFFFYLKDVYSSEEVARKYVDHLIQLGGWLDSLETLRAGGSVDDHAYSETKRLIDESAVQYLTHLRVFSLYRDGRLLQVDWDPGWKPPADILRRTYVSIALQVC